MADGWKGVIGHSWAGVEDEGETAKKTINSEKGKKYKVKHPKTQEDVVTFDSVLEGISKQDQVRPIDPLVREWRNKNHLSRAKY